MSEAIHTNGNPDLPNGGTATSADSTDLYYGLTSNWSVASDLAGHNLPFRVEGEVSDLVVLGEIPEAIDGIFYRVMSDPFVPPHPKNIPLDGDGNISAFQIRNGRVDMRIRYVETERYKLERKAKKALFGLYRNPFTHHPCVRAAVDSTANTNVVYWAGHLLALKEGALPYSVDPITLHTLTYDPFGDQVKAKTFSAHPKIDPYTNELVVFGYEAKGLGTRDIVIYTLDADGKKHDEQWILSPWTALIHDSIITPNWIVLVLWPFEANVARMKAGGHHWAWDYDLKTTFIVAPRRKSTPLPQGWKEGEYRYYEWENCMAIHTGGGWETDDGKIFLETSRVHDNAFPFFPPDDGRMPPPETKADYVLWELDLSKSHGSKIPDPVIVLDLPCEFPRIDERFMTGKYDVLFLDVFLPRKSDGSKNIFHGLNGLAMHRRSTGKTEFFYAGEDSLVQEPAFIPRSDTAPEGDGWVIAMVERRSSNMNDLVIIDTKNFENPIAIVHLPFHVKAQTHGNWVDTQALKETKEIVRQITGDLPISGRGALEPL